MKSVARHTVHTILFSCSVVVLCLLFCPTTSLFAQWYTDPAQPTLLPLGVYHPKLIADRENGAYLISTDRGSLPYYIFHFDSAGYSTLPDSLTVLFGDTLPYHSYGIQASPVATSDNGLVYFIRRWDDQQELIDSRMVKILPDGTFPWTNMGIALSEDWLFRDLVAADNGGVWIVLDSPVNEFTNFHVVKLFADGSVDFNDPIEICSYDYHWGYSTRNVITDQEGGFYFFLFSSHGLDPAGLYGNHFSADGEGVSDSGLVFLLPREDCSTLTLSLNEDNSVTLMCNYVPIPHANNSILTRIDENLQFVWEDTLVESFDDSAFGAISDIQPDHHGGFWYKRPGAEVPFTPYCIGHANNAGDIIWNAFEDSIWHYEVSQGPSLYEWSTWRSDDYSFAEWGFFKVDDVFNLAWDSTMQVLAYQAESFAVAPSLDARAAVTDGRGGLIFTGLVDVSTEDYKSTIGRITSDGVLGSDNSIPEHPNRLPEVPTDFTVIHAYPNPFNNDVKITIDSDELIRSVTIYNMLGQIVTSFNLNKTSHHYNIIWNTNSTRGTKLSSGTYIITVVTSDHTFSKKILHLQ